MASKRDITVLRRKSAGRKINNTENSEDLSVVPVRRKPRRSLLRVLFRLIIVIAIIIGVVYTWQNWDVIAPEGFIFWINDKLAGGQSGDGFPVEITGGSVLNMSNTKDGLALLTDTSVVVLNSKGGEIMRRQHGFSKPIMRTNDKWILIADTGGGRIRIETRGSTKVEMKINNRIISAAMGSNGGFALATDSTKYTSEVVAYNRQQEKIFHWCDTELTVLDIALSPNGKSMVVVGVMADGGAMKCSLLFFDFDKENPVAEYHSTDLMLFSAEYFPGGTVAAVGDRGLWVFNESGTIQQKHSFEDYQLAGYTVGDRSVAVALRNFGNTDGGTVLTVNSTGDKAYSVPYEGVFRSISPYKTGILLLTSEQLYHTDAAGVIYNENAIRDGRMVCSLGNKMIILGLTSLNEINTVHS
ncbi:MAG: DUF5711 family protein [Oscillospiraceae bacterium]|nr:DUF5711 family protein [Oscillospiraceae bacterium]MDD4413698.1 DUF5711 family protein [Oscillospiraceae bacterium]